MDVLETIRKRRSIRNYRSDELPDNVLQRLLEVLRLAPSSGNHQPYKFIVVRDKATRVALASACRWNPGRSQGHEFIADAPLVIVACGFEREAITRYYRGGQCYLTTNKNVAEIEKDPLPWWNMMPLDAAIALDYIDLTAVSLGLGTCWVASLDELAVKKVLSIPDEARVVSAMAIGYPSTTWPEPRPRKSLETSVCYEKYV
jgi:nitroreductase